MCLFVAGFPVHPVPGPSPTYPPASPERGKAPAVKYDSTLSKGRAMNPSCVEDVGPPGDPAPVLCE